MIKNNPKVYCILIVLIFTFTHVFHALAKQDKTLLFIGSYTDSEPSEGIYIYDFNTQTGELMPLGTGKNLVNPSFLALSPNGKYLYACTKTKLPSSGTLSAFAIDSVKGEINFINEEVVGARNPVHVDVHPSGKQIAVASYTDPVITLFQTNKEGFLAQQKQSIEFVDKSINKKRQENAHLHSANFSPDGNYLFVPDLGGDKIRAFSLKNEEFPRLLVNDVLTVKTTAGGGPRHMAFHPKGKYAYLVEELSGTLAAFQYEHGKLTLLNRYFSYSKKYPDYGSADVHVTQDGKFVYVTNRLHDENTIAIYSISFKDGNLELIGHHSTLGIKPRNFVIDPTDQFVLVANVTSNNVVVLKRDKSTGLLQDTGVEIKINNPSCLKMRTYKQ